MRVEQPGCNHPGQAGGPCARPGVATNTSQAPRRSWKRGYAGRPNREDTASAGLPWKPSDGSPRQCRRPRRCQRSCRGSHQGSGCPGRTAARGSHADQHRPSGKINDGDQKSASPRRDRGKALRSVYWQNYIRIGFTGPRRNSNLRIWHGLLIKGQLRFSKNQGFPRCRAVRADSPA